MKELEKLRQDYTQASLNIQDVADSPIVQFENWMKQAIESKVLEPNAMILGTANVNGDVTQRTVLLKGLSNQGFVWYTNYESQKAQDLKENPKASLLFLWLDIQRQVRIEGKVEKVPRAQSEAYFKSRPKASQIGAWASSQSRPIKDRSILENNVISLQEKYKNSDVLPCPPHWGGYILVPEKVEFWQGRSSRLHDRIRYTTDENGQWTCDRLAP